MSIRFKLSIICITFFVLISCGSPNLLKRDNPENTSSYFTESINYARQGFLDIEMPGTVELQKEASLRGLANHTLLKIYDQVAITTRNGFLHFMNQEDLESDQNTRISPAISTPPSYYRNFLYIASELGEEGLKAYDIFKGKIIWSKKGYLSRSSPVVANNMVYHASLKGKILALNYYTGEKIWEGTMNDKILTSMAYSSGYLTAASLNGTLRTFDSSSGSVIWSLDIDDAVHTHPVIKANRLFLLTYSGDLYIINLKNGIIQEKIAFDTPFYFSASVDDENLYIPCSDGYVVSLNLKDLEENWSIKLEGTLSTGILVTKNHLYCGTGQKYFYVIDRMNGEIIQKIKLEGRPRTIPLITDNRLYIAYERKHIALVSAP